MKRVAVFGLALTGTAVARALHERGYEIVLGDDRISDAHRALASDLACELIDMAQPNGVRALLEGVDTLLPAPGVPPRHEVISEALRSSVAVRTEIDVAYEWEQERIGGPRPILGVTGTDGKTTTTMLTAHILRELGKNVAEVGNTDLPFMAALADSYDAFVVECSSFRLQYTTQFRCESSVWLNLAPDHLDWHPTLDHYVAAKSNMWKFARSTDVAVVPTRNTLIDEVARASHARIVTFGIDTGDYHVENDVLIGPTGPLISVADLWRSMPHDISNSLAAAALVVESGLADSGDVGPSLTNFALAHHRIELVGTFDGSQWFDDSKATSPHAALTAIRAFDKLVLIAGGRNKDLDLSQMATEPHRMVGVVAIGDDAPLIEDAFAGVCPVVHAMSMNDAVREASLLAQPGVAVVLSPGCTSYDWYNNYNERGDDFKRSVHAFFNDQAGA